MTAAPACAARSAEGARPAGGAVGARRAAGAAVVSRTCRGRAARSRVRPRRPPGGTGRACARTWAAGRPGGCGGTDGGVRAAAVPGGDGAPAGRRAPRPGEAPRAPVRGPARGSARARPPSLPDARGRYGRAPPVRRAHPTGPAGPTVSPPDPAAGWRRAWDGRRRWCSRRRSPAPPPAGEEVGETPAHCAAAPAVTARVTRHDHPDERSTGLTRQPAVTDRPSGRCAGSVTAPPRAGRGKAGGRRHRRAAPGPSGRARTSAGSPPRRRCRP